MKEDKKWCIRGSEELHLYFNKIGVDKGSKNYNKSLVHNGEGLSGSDPGQFYFLTKKNKWDYSRNLNDLEEISLKKYITEINVSKEHEFKIGDWVVFMPEVAEKAGCHTAVWNKPYVLRILRISDTTYGFKGSDLTKAGCTYKSITGECANYKMCFRKATSSEILKEDLLEKAIKEYPIGTVFNSAANPQAKNLVVEHTPVFKEDSIACQDGGKNGIIYSKGSWATIISPPKEDPISLREQAIKRYPIGSKILSALKTGEGRPIRVDQIGPTESVNNYTVVWNMENGSKLGFLYRNGEWAEIVEQAKTIDPNLIEKAKDRYPIGSIFIDLVNKKEFQVLSHDFNNYGVYSQLYIRVAKSSESNLFARIYKDGVWAKSLEKISVGSYIMYKGTKANGNWEEYFGSKGVKAGDVGKISSISSSEYGQTYFINDNIRTDNSGFLCREDFEVISGKEAEERARKKEDTSKKFPLTIDSQFSGSLDESNEFKPGDKVILKGYYLGRFNNGNVEGVDWALKDGIPLNTELIVEKTDENGAIWLCGYLYMHPSKKFTKVHKYYMPPLKAENFEWEIKVPLTNPSLPKKIDVKTPILMEVKKIKK